MNRLVPAAFAAALGLLAGCSLFRWSGYADPAAAPSAAVAPPEAPPERRAAALFYSDLGPDTVDLAAYPEEKKREYEVYARVCSRCHTLARSVNAPFVDRSWWEFYLASMRVRAYFHAEPLSRQETQAVLDFLEYDSNERKVERAAEFEARTAELKRRFEVALDERMEKLQRNPLPHRAR